MTGSGQERDTGTGADGGAGDLGGAAGTGAGGLGGPGGLVGRSIDEFVQQLRGFTERARSVAGAVPTRLSLPALPQPPGALSAAQLQAIASAVSAQRRQIDAMKEQLEAFDQQLAVFERILDPLVEWSATWARLEEAVGDLVRRDPSSGGQSRGPAGTE
ncbi:hypothetical protein OF117_00780 [Geodermatophilus sp. YIM 151500]|uniref:hypothetical protein n=1 Tax=Geodermatophilus sp. YIM 151500 TaxID=2984531 RepID=UPI0021E3FECF|nr:hypothetical protein [Geodermatophilus sp. YIM 151500]MCV2487881.1 hypothetical protein [Geodermatophilus sp. YIM 151500]